MTLKTVSFADTRAAIEKAYDKAYNTKPCPHCGKIHDGGHRDPKGKIQSKKES